MTTTMTQKQEKAIRQDRARAVLNSWINPGDTVYTVLKHVSTSGMMRHISLYICLNGKIVDISWHAAQVLDYKRADNGGLKIGGGGMDMGYHLVYSLASVLFKDGFQCPGHNCPHNSHTNEGTARDGKVYHNDKYTGGYALNHQWL
ncbi:MAG: hypothetical protein KGI08_02585 [Thaumarchaeota archaeon]|nr:hypothetical protein [Nitrososphaerota archaeon]